MRGTAAQPIVGAFLQIYIEHIDDLRNSEYAQLLPTEWKDALHPLLLEEGRGQIPAAGV